MNKKLNLHQLCTAFLLVLLCGACTSEPVKKIGVQAHRGGAALYPENTIPAMIHAVEIGTRTLELDLQITRDSQVVVSHDSYLNSTKALYPDRKIIPKELEPTLQLFFMDYDSIRKFDLGTLQNPLFPRRKNVSCILPTLTDLIDCVEAYTYAHHIKPVSYNIEIKSSPEKDDVCTPGYETFCDLSLEVLMKKELKERLCIQSFDTRALNYIHSKYPQIQLSYLVDGNGYSVKYFLSKLNFIPQIISPDYTIVNETFVEDAHDYNMKVIPWTVDKKEDVLRLKQLGVDEIITNQPDSVQAWLTMDDQRKQYTQACSFFENLMGY